MQTVLLVLLLGAVVLVQAFPAVPHEAHTSEYVLKPAVGGGGTLLAVVATNVAKSIAVSLAAKAIWQRISKTKFIERIGRWVRSHIRLWW